jgi:hypothetical protein
MADRLGTLKIAALPPPWAVRVTLVEVADQFLHLRVNRNDGLAFGLCGNNFGVDMFKLGIAVGMVRSFIGLAIELAREPE